jgi:hypothetical protein
VLLHLKAVQVLRSWLELARGGRAARGKHSPALLLCAQHSDCLGNARCLTRAMLRYAC